MSKYGKDIRFFDIDYRERFRIPDGGNIKVTYPPGDDRGIQVCKCKYIDETHTRIGGNVFLISEFVERMETLHARLEPEAQLQNVELVPFVAGEEKYYAYIIEEDNTCVGYIVGDFGSDGDHYYSEWRDRKNGRNTPEFQVELHSAMYALRQGLLKDYDSMLAYCKSHPDAKLCSEDKYDGYGFKLETDTRQYFVMCYFWDTIMNSRFIANAYDKAAPVRGQEQNQPSLS